MAAEFKKAFISVPKRSQLLRCSSKRIIILTALSLSLFSFFTFPRWLQLSQLLSYRQLSFLDNPAQSAPLPPLKFKRDGTFQLSIFSDLHFGENAWESWGPRQDVESIRVINTVLDTEPATDLVVLNGDLITGENVFRHNGSEYVDVIAQALSARGVTWGSAYGNHDSDRNLSPTEMFEREKGYRGSRTGRMVSGEEGEVGVTNYYLPVWSWDGKRVEMVLWFFDSRGGFRFQEEVGRENWVHPKVVGWFRETNERLKREYGGRRVPGLGFVHIPTTAFLEVQEEAGVGGRKRPGINADVPVSRQGGGWCDDGTDGEGCEYGGQDRDFMEAVMETEGLVGLFVGHDHGDTWCSDYAKKERKVFLCFGQHTGYGGYGNWIRGSRQVGVSVEGLDLGEMDTWVRLENGKVVGKVRLNPTYGGDEYENVEDEKTHLPVDGESADTVEE
ncbi:Metallo-dependent phosphatase-like protein [Triangularia verruculosa]|uniref:Metallo-dependent phosphatase-like protein n=1 Tax=Triangularia verruculosa TaxID=2587418 RepID=A0AAN6XAG2_9PEZI|nr:Metallo-dependent phosphatase-like protein [Triangularia verruculosa]